MFGGSIMVLLRLGLMSIGSMKWVQIVFEELVC